METKNRTYPPALKLLFRGIAIFAAAVLLISSIKSIPEGCIGIKYQFGKIVRTDLQAGLNFMLPFVQSIELVDIREQVNETTTSAYTKDTQTVERIICTLNYSYMGTELPNIIRNIGVHNVESKLIIPQVNSILKNEVGKYKAEELIQNRATMQEAVEDVLRESLSKSGITVHAFNVKDIDFEDSFEDVIRAKVAAEQDAMRKKNETVAKEEEARQLVIAAQAKADAKKLEADAEAYAISKVQEQLKSSPEYNELQKIQKWNGALPSVMGNSVNPFVALDPVK